MQRVTKSIEERRQEIIDTAIRLFYERGYEKTSISDIAKEMGVAQGLCYRYFSSKEELFETALDYYAQIIVDGFISSLDNTKEQTLKEIILNMPSFIEAEHMENSFYGVCHNERSKKIHDRLTMIVSVKLVPIVSEMLSFYNTKGEINIEEPEIAASFFVFGQFGILNNDALSKDEKMNKIRNFIIKMLYGDKS